ncbi:MAG: hypothetical protein AABW68_03250 [archaeon]
MKRMTATRARLVSNTRSKPSPDVIEQLKASFDDIRAGRIRKAVH